MKPLIHQYAEIGESTVNLEFTEYSDRLNLNVIIGTEIPAVSNSLCSTETFTKAQVDTSESDEDFRYSLCQYLDTRLQTRALVDETGNDDDANHLHN